MSGSPNNRNSTARDRRVGNSLLWSFSGAAGCTVLEVLLLVVLARLLTPQDFGIVAAALIVVRFSSMFSQLGVGPAIIQREELLAAHVRTGVALSLLFGAACGMVVLLLAAPAAALLRIEGLRPVLEVMCLLFPVQAMSVVAHSLLQRELKFGRIALAELPAVGLGYGLTGIALAAAGWGAWALVGAHLARTALRTALLIAVRPHPLVPRLDRRAARELLCFGTGHTGGNVAAYVANQAGGLVIGRWLGAAALGIYGRAHQLMVSPVVLFSKARDKVLFSTMARAQSDPGSLDDAYRRGITLTAVVVLPASVVLCVLTPELVALLLGPGWSGVVLPGQILAMGILLQSGHRLSDSLIRASGRVYRNAWRQGVFAVAVILGAWIGQHRGVGGATLGMLAALAVHYLVMATLSLSITGGTSSGFGAAHLPSFGLTALVGSAVWSAAGLLRAWDMPPALVLLATLAGAGLSLLLACLRPRLFLGEDGTQVLAQFRKRLRESRSAARESPPTGEDRPADHDAGGLAAAYRGPVRVIHQIQP